VPLTALRCHCRPHQQVNVDTLVRMVATYTGHDEGDEDGLRALQARLQKALRDAVKFSDDEVAQLRVRVRAVAVPQQQQAGGSAAVTAAGASPLTGGLSAQTGMSGRAGAVQQPSSKQRKRNPLHGPAYATATSLADDFMPRVGTGNLRPFMLVGGARQLGSDVQRLFEELLALVADVALLKHGGTAATDLTTQQLRTHVQNHFSQVNGRVAWERHRLYTEACAADQDPPLHIEEGGAVPLWHGGPGMAPVPRPTSKQPSGELPLVDQRRSSGKPAPPPPGEAALPRPIGAWTVEAEAAWVEGRLPAQLVAMAEQLRKSAVPTTRVGAVQGLQGMMVEAFKEVVGAAPG
jgi:ElaB/YqjD/DUF883 family membrane-anchored ribosome-binding protein